MSMRTYEQGFRDGMKMKNGVDSTFTFMGYAMEKLLKIITEYEERQSIEKPAVEIRTRLGFEIKIWADGRIEGIEGIVTNRIPELIAKANQK